MMNADACTCADDCATGFNPNCACARDECGCSDISGMIGKKRAKLFHALCAYILESYGLDGVWKRLKIKTKKWKYEYKFSAGGKTICGFYITNNCLGFMVILGKAERAKLEKTRAEYSEPFLSLYDAAETYHDGKWLMAELDDALLFDDLKKLLSVKRKPKLR